MFIGYAQLKKVEAPFKSIRLWVKDFRALGPVAIFGLR
jgi:hypothetical protein